MDFTLVSISKEKAINLLSNRETRGKVYIRRREGSIIEYSQAINLKLSFGPVIGGAGIDLDKADFYIERKIELEKKEHPLITSARNLHYELEDSKSSLIIKDESINKSDVASINAIMRKYPKHKLILLFDGEIHLSI